MTEEQIKSLQATGGEHLAATEKNILGNHLGELWETVKELRGKTGGRVDFVLDNAGFELYCDCVYADFLIQSGLASQVRFHGKRYPWFVSDVTRKDWEWLLRHHGHNDKIDIGGCALYLYLLAVTVSVLSRGCGCGWFVCVWMCG